MKVYLSGVVAALSLVTVVTGCARNECKLDDPSTCSSDQVCEAVQGQEKPMCVQPVQIEGKVFDIASGAAIAGARVTPVDVNGAPAGSVAVTGADGRYVVRIPSERTDEKGAFVAKTVTLRASAKNYVTFPSGIRTALPVETSSAAQAESDKPFVVSSAATDIGLNPLPDAEKGRPSISGTVQLAAGQKGVLVVAEATGTRGPSTIADDKGTFTIFNVTPGTYSVKAYSQGSNYTPAEVTVAAGMDTTGVSLTRSEVPAATVTGNVSLVQLTGTGANLTSVVLAVKSTYDPTLVRGELPPGLRAPPPGTAPNLGAGATFTIEGVPDGEYAVLAAFENDGLVRDPNPGTAGTTVQFVTVQNGAQVRTLNTFKVTSAIVPVGPGATAVEEVSGTPTFSWQKYPSAASYDLVVFDSLGDAIWTPARMTASGSATVSVPYAGTTALEAGKLYQWRVTANSTAGNPIGRTEDLVGVFRIAM